MGTLRKGCYKWNKLTTAATRISLTFICTPPMAAPTDGVKWPLPCPECPEVRTIKSIVLALRSLEIKPFHNNAVEFKTGYKHSNSKLNQFWCSTSCGKELPGARLIPPCDNVINVPIVGPPPNTSTVRQLAENAKKATAHNFYRKKHARVHP